MINPFDIIIDQLAEIKSQLATIPQAEIKQIEIIDSDEMCKRLGISLPTLIRHRKRNIPFIEIGNSIRFNWPEVIAALELQKKKK